MICFGERRRRLKKKNLISRLEDDSWRFKKQKDLFGSTSKVQKSFFNVAHSSRASDTPSNIIWRALFARREKPAGVSREKGKRVMTKSRVINIPEEQKFGPANFSLLNMDTVTKIRAQPPRAIMAKREDARYIKTPPSSPRRRSAN